MDSTSLLLLILLTHINFIDFIVQGICGNMIGNRNCSKDSLCEVSRGRFLDSCTCNDGYLGNGFVCEGN